MQLYCYLHCKANGVIFNQDRTLLKFKKQVASLYGDNLDRLILFGSRARGDSTSESDYDIAVFLKSMPDRWTEIDRLAALRLPYLEEGAAFFDVMPYRAEDYDKETGLMSAIRAEGVPL
jgi:predicted nucleotidyltransferase